MGETAVAMPRPADSPVGVPAPREAPRAVSVPPPPPNHSTPSQTDRLKIRETEELALAATKREIEEAKDRNKAKTETPDTKPPVKTAPPPPASEIAPELPPGVTPADIARLQSEIKSGTKTPKQAELALENLVNKAMGVSSSEVHDTPPVSQKKTVHKEVTPPSPKTSSASPPPPVEHKSENSFLSKIKKTTEKVFSIPLAIIKAIWSWISK